MNFKSRTQENAYKQEWGYVTGRQFLLAIVAIGSMIVTMNLGGYVGELMFGKGSPWAIFAMKCFFVFLCFLAIDWVLINSLSSASNITNADIEIIDEDTGERISQNNDAGKRSIWQLATASLIATIALSIASNFLISFFIGGENPAADYNRQIEAAMDRDSVLRSKALETIALVGAEERNRIQQAREQAAALLAAAVAEGSPSWQKDYRNHKDNPRGWFWTCTDCPPAYKQYRNEILEAREKGRRLIEEARGYSGAIVASLSPTLSYESAKDSTLMQYGLNTAILARERQVKIWIINVFLAILTISCGLLAFFVSKVLLEHRRQHGQFVIENHTGPIMTLLDLSGQFVDGVRDILYTIVSLPYRGLKSRNLIFSYEPNHEIRGMQIDHGRRCLNCGTDISHKRKDAKFCSDSCRASYN